MFLEEENIYHHLIGEICLHVQFSGFFLLTLLSCQLVAPSTGAQLPGCCGDCHRQRRCARYWEEYCGGGAGMQQLQVSHLSFV